MKAISIIFLLSFSYSAFGQSAKKLNKQLRAELLVEQQKQDSASLTFSKSYNEISLLKEQLMMKSKELQKGIKNIRQTKEEVRQVVNLLGMLGENVDVSKLNKYGNLPDSVNKLKPIEDLMKTIEPFEAVPSNLSLEGLKVSQQNELLKEKLAVYRNSIQENELRLQRNNFRKDQLEQGGPQVDSVISMIKRAHLSAVDNKKGLDKQVEALRENYRTKGPKGFSAAYRRAFPDIHPLPPGENDDIVMDGSMDSEGDYDAALVQKKSSIPAQEPEIYEVVDEPAMFPGGYEALKKYLAENIVYPSFAKEAGISGKVFLKFVVSDKGKVSNVKIMRGIPDCPECDKEAIRVVKGMPKWIPGKISGKAVNSLFNLPVQFKL